MKKLVRITTVPMSLNKLLEDQLSFMNSHYKVIAVSSDKEKLVEVGKKEGVETFHLEMTRKITPLKDCLAVWKLYKYLKSEKPHVVHTHTPKAGIVGMLAAKLAGVQHRLHTVAGLPLLETTGIKRQILNAVETLTYSCATKVYPNSKGLEGIIVENKFTRADKLKIIANGSSNGIDTSYFNPELIPLSKRKKLKTELNINDEDFVFVFVGRVVGDKGINELVSAFKKISKTYINSKLLLVGPLENDLDPLSPITLKTIEINKQIISVGYQEDVRPYFAISNALTFPSYREGFPNVVMQACAMELPCIVTNINGCNEIIINNKNGSVIPVKNAENLYVTMKMYLDNQNHISEMKMGSRARIKEKYERTVVCEALLDEYKNL